MEPAYVALALTPGIGRARFEALIAAFGSAGAVMTAGPEALARVPGISPAAATAIAGRGVDDGLRVLAQVEATGGVALRPGIPGFPSTLAAIPEAPVLLFARGNLDLLAQPAVAIVGSRAHSRYGAEAARHFAAGAARAGLVVVSGMARGIDALAHEAALDAGGGSVGVLGNGFGVIYPSANRRLYGRMAEAGCLVTEFPPGDRPNAGSFPRRNRLISGLARVTLVIEAAEKSGALLTVENALLQGREVLAVPGPITSPVSVGCNRLIQNGAKPALGLRDLLEEYGLGPPGVPAATVARQLSEDERRVLDLVGPGDRHVDEIAAGLARPAADTLAVLTSLEIRGIVTQEPGKRFRRATPHFRGSGIGERGG